MAEQAYLNEHGQYVAAGPVPKQVARGVASPFVADEGFRALGWAPEGRRSIPKIRGTPRRGTEASIPGFRITSRSAQIQ